MGNYNVVDKYSWTSVPANSQYRKEAPRINLRAYKIKQNQINRLIESYIELLENKKADTFYKELYKAELQHTFWLPFFNDTARNFGNNFADAFSGGTPHGTSHLGTNLTETVNKFGGAAFSMWGTIKTMAANAPGSYIETPKFYQYENSDSPLEISFVLSNTIDEGDIERNYNLIKTLMEINRPLRIDAITMEPPLIYKVILPGYRYMEWAFCNNLNVSLLGARKLIDKKIIPEAYQITMSMTSLTVEHREFVDYTDQF